MKIHFNIILPSTTALCFSSVKRRYFTQKKIKVTRVRKSEGKIKTKNERKIPVTVMWGG
jgi:hypothetical protein